MSPNKLFFIFTLMMFGILASPLHAADITITVSNIRSDQGVVRVFVCTADQFLGEHCQYKKNAPARSGIMTFILQGIPPGLYAVQTYHDENNNGKLDFGFLGLFPSEGYGVSKVEHANTEPRFTDAAFEIVDSQNTMSVLLTYP